MSSSGPSSLVPSLKGFLERRLGPQGRIVGIGGGSSAKVVPTAFVIILCLRRRRAEWGMGCSTGTARQWIDRVDATCLGAFLALGVQTCHEVGKCGEAFFGSSTPWVGFALGRTVSFVRCNGDMVMVEMGV